MKLAIISDIHGNLIALEAVLAALAAENVEQIICLGDVAADGPQPRQVIDRLRQLNCPIVMGNADAWFLDPQPYPMRDENSPRFTDLAYWGLTQLRPSDFDYLRSFQPTLTIPVGAERLFCFHGSPRSNTELIVATTPESDLAAMLNGVEATFMVGGHSHAQMLRRYRQTLLFNPGSVGLPYQYPRQGDQARNPPWAEYALLHQEADRVALSFHRTPIDAQAVVEAIRASGMPHADWLAKAWLI